ncbi:hypothetical protein LIER_42173 [Lithospermum erythrorhizon]|uniref:Uncharacterized protein n=1 Tax=Lithospermum erythrorhizon TaxID=34254 RepID=A0AAV3RKH3_LITER
MAKVRGHMLDNKWVIPYNVKLLAQFNCHINVEICCDIRVVKYLYKYIHKGHDKVLFCIAPNTPGSNIYEISDFQNERWVSPVEATWRIYGFLLNGMFPSVVQLQVHLPNFQTIQFEDDPDLEDIIQDGRLKKTIFTELFETNRTDPEAKKCNFLYKEFPKYYVWNAQWRAWTTRKKRSSHRQIVYCQSC